MWCRLRGGRRCLAPLLGVQRPLQLLETLAQLPRRPYLRRQLLRRLVLPGRAPQLRGDACQHVGQRRLLVRQPILIDLGHGWRAPSAQPAETIGTLPHPLPDGRALELVTRRAHRDVGRVGGIAVGRQIHQRAVQRVDTVGQIVLLVRETEPRRPAAIARLHLTGFVSDPMLGVGQLLRLELQPGTRGRPAPL